MLISLANSGKSNHENSPISNRPDDNPSAIEGGANLTGEFQRVLPIAVKADGFSVDGYFRLVMG